ncbi:pentapeptide repeat-containing protein [Rivularia sp. UHCC 0363]|uniref:pentapeptide repeat-containing protein n=1 Tax=Rivularia sp. UHCC 0363 TaxID=3110244 RepID=UPI002B2099B7|nr:pentapeptide repeat-containing protein [Rivularia sp. UHCC 0363]MEA5593234.1 pentapeptide repeat-containing protein [Rivularia sp. UHCC 0363]
MRVPDNKTIKKRLKAAIEQLSEPHIEQRLTAIDNLQQIADEYPAQYDRIIQIVTKFIQTNRSLKLLNDDEINPIAQISTDIQIALNFVTNPDINEYLRRDKIDLSYTDIRGANLRGANLKKINLQQSILYRTNLVNANLEDVNLNGALLCAANLCHANFTRANLCGAILSAANLCGTNLTHADLRNANLFLANLQGANLDGANFDGANLREAKFCGNKANQYL